MKKEVILMKIISIEPTPSPNTMKLNMDESLPTGVKYDFTRDSGEKAPDYIQQLLAVEGVKGVYQVADFIALERFSKADWRSILAEARRVFGEDAAQVDEMNVSETGRPTFGEVNVFFQMFRGLPMQVKLTTETEEVRVGLPERFAKSAMKAQSVSTNLVMERKWVEQGVRYGDLKEIGEEVARELSAAYDEERLERLVAQAFEQTEGGSTVDESISSKEVANQLDDPDWEKRFAALERMKPTKEDIPLLSKALTDSNQSIRRLATVYLGLVGEPEVLPYLFRALKDKSVSVRRTAGDALSDIGDPAAIGAMIDALDDPNKLVRWRAARFLYEIGDETAVPALRATQSDPEFEVSLQVKIALERIEGGEAASGTVWQQMTRSMADKKKGE
jgi:hypothetical protein